jgi:copper chaperone CopZ
MSITINVEGMSCQHCVANVKGKLEALAEVTTATPSLDDKNIVIEGDNLNMDAIKQAVADAGYSVTD